MPASKKPFKIPEVGDRFRVIHSSYKFNGDYLTYEVFKLATVADDPRVRVVCWRVDELHMAEDKRDTMTFIETGLANLQENQMLMRLRSGESPKGDTE